MTRWQTTAAAVGLVVVVLALYGPHVARASFVYQDARLIEASDRPWDWTQVWRGRGLSTESWTLIRTPRAAHALNVGLHLAVIGLVGFLFARVTGRADVGLAISALVAVHPLASEGVAYAASRAELLAAGGAVLALLCATARSVWPWACLPAAIALAYLGKDTGLVVIGLIPLVWWLQGRQALAWRGAAVVLGLGLIALPFLGTLTTLAEHSGRQVDPWTWAAIQGAAVFRLVVLSVAPIMALSIDPAIVAPPRPVVVALLVLLVGLVEMAWRARHSAPLVTAGLVGMAIVAAPRFLVRTPDAPFTEHQWYLALPFVACVLTGGLTWAADQIQARPHGLA